LVPARVDTPSQFPRAHAVRRAAPWPLPAGARGAAPLWLLLTARRHQAPATARAARAARRCDNDRHNEREIWERAPRPRLRRRRPFFRRARQIHSSDAACNNSAAKRSNGACARELRRIYRSLLRYSRTAPTSSLAVRGTLFGWLRSCTAHSSVRDTAEKMTWLQGNTREATFLARRKPHAQQQGEQVDEGEERDG
jgi:hypothetical protein